MNNTNLTTQWLPISKKRENECKKISLQFISHLETKGYNVDDYAKFFIDAIFQRILVGPKAYRVYDAHDVNSQWHESAKQTIAEGTLHHMYLKDNNLTYGLVRDSWCKEKLSIGYTKEETVNRITDLICSKTFYLKFVKLMGINRKSN